MPKKYFGDMNKYIGVPGIGGGVLPTSLTDDFSADSGKWLDGDLAAAAITISGGKGIWTPTEGAEIHTSANAASDPNGNEASATTGWSVTGMTLAVESVDVDTGSYAIKATAADGSSDRTNYGENNATRGWRLLRTAAKRVTGTSWFAGWAQGWIHGRVPITDAWADYVIGLYKNADFQDFNLWCNAGAASDVALMDNVSYKSVTDASTFRVRRIYYPSTIGVKVWNIANVPTGVVCYKDANNYVVAMLYSLNGATYSGLYKRVGGVFSAVQQSQAVTIVAGTQLTLVPSADMQTWSVTYGAATPISAQSITDFAASGVWYAGLFNIYNPGDMSVSFDDFVAERVTAAPPF